MCKIFFINHIGAASIDTSWAETWRSRSATDVEEWQSEIFVETDATENLKAEFWKGAEVSIGILLKRNRCH